MMQLHRPLADLQRQRRREQAVRHDQRLDRRVAAFQSRPVLLQRPRGQLQRNDLAILEDGVARDVIGVPVAEDDGDLADATVLEVLADEASVGDRDMRVVDQRFRAIDDGIGGGAQLKGAIVQPVRLL